MELHKIKFQKVKDKYINLYKDTTYLAKESIILKTIENLENKEDRDSSLYYGLEEVISQKNNDEIIKNLLAKKNIEIDNNLSKSTLSHLKHIIRSIKNNTGLWFFIIFFSMGMFGEFWFGILYTILIAIAYGGVLYGIYIIIKQLKIKNSIKKEYLLLEIDLNEITNKYNEELLQIYDLLLKGNYKKIEYEYITKIWEGEEEYDRQMREDYRDRDYM